MSDSEVVDVFMEALSQPSDEVLAALSAQLADDVVYAGPGGHTAEGREQVVEAVRNDRLRSFYADGQWSLAESNGASAKVRVKFADGAPIAGAQLVFELAGDKIARVTFAGIHAPPPVTEVDLSGDLKALIDEAWSVSAMLVAYVDADGQPHIAPRGSVHVFSKTEVAMWIYSQGMPRGLEANPHVALWYSDDRGEIPFRFGIEGVARIAAGEERDRVFEGSPPHEQAHDLERRGVGVIVDVKTVAGRTPIGQLNMKHDA